MSRQQIYIRPPTLHRRIVLKALRDIAAERLNGKPTADVASAEFVVSVSEITDRCRAILSDMAVTTRQVGLRLSAIGVREYPHTETSRRRIFSAAELEILLQKNRMTDIGGMAKAVAGSPVAQTAESRLCQQSAAAK